METIEEREFHFTDDDMDSARRYHERAFRHRNDLEQWDADCAIYHSLSEGAREALEYLCYIGEIE